MDSRLAQPRNTRESRVHASFKKVTVRSAPHEWKGSSLSQRVDDALPLPRKRIASNDEQYAKALPSIPLTLSGTTSDSSEEHPSNALSLIYLSPSVRVRAVSYTHLYRIYKQRTAWLPAWRGVCALIVAAKYDLEVCHIRLLVLLKWPADHQLGFV